MNGEARERVLTGDRKIPEGRIAEQEEYKEDAWQARELTPVAGATLDDINLDRLNEYIQLYNRQVKIETIKADLTAALPFLTRKSFVVDGRVTTLCVLVCGNHPADLLGFRCRVHGYVDVPHGPIPLRRIIPEAKPRNPQLATVLMVYNRWEGEGIGMATLTNLCLQNQIDLPYYRLYSEDEVGLCLCAGHLLDERMEELFKSFDGYISERLQGRILTEEQKRVLAYLMKSEWANRELRYTIMLTPDNNHSSQLDALKNA